MPLHPWEGANPFVACAFDAMSAHTVRLHVSIPHYASKWGMRAWMRRCLQRGSGYGVVQLGCVVLATLTQSMKEQRNSKMHQEEKHQKKEKKQNQKNKEKEELESPKKRRSDILQKKARSEQQKDDQGWLGAVAAAVLLLVSAFACLCMSGNLG